MIVSTKSYYVLTGVFNIICCSCWGLGFCCDCVFFVLLVVCVGCFFLGGGLFLI